MRAFRLMVVVVIMFCGCAAVPVETQLPVGWSSVLHAADVPPLTQCSLWISNATPILAWHDPQWVVQISSGKPIKLPLGIDPRQGKLIGGDNGSVHLLWLDRAVDTPGEIRLMAAHLTASLSLDRGPTVISTLDTQEYSALALPSGSVLVLWTAHSSNPAAPLYMQVIDALGRPHPPRVI